MLTVPLLRRSLIGLAAFGLSLTTHAAAEIGQPAPAFTAQGADGKPVSPAFFKAMAVCPATQKSQPCTLAAVICTTSRSARLRLARALMPETVR